MIGLYIVAGISLITIIWYLTIDVALSKNTNLKGRLYNTDYNPWWFWGFGIIFFIDILGLLYAAIFLVFFFDWRMI